MHDLACRTTADRMAAHRKSDRRHAYPCAVGFRKRAQECTAVGYSDYLDTQPPTSVMSKDRRDCDDQKKGTKQEQTESGTTNLSCSDAALAPPNRKGEV